MTIVIDPGRATGVTIDDGGTLMVAKIEDFTAAEIRTLLRWARGHGHRQLVIEGQYVEPRQDKVTKRWTINWPSLERLVLSAHRWVVIGELLGFKIERVMPSVWQGPMFRSVPTHEGKKKLSTKQRSKFVVARCYSTLRRFKREKDGNAPAGSALTKIDPASAKQVSGDKVPHDICDSVCMARWYRLHGGGR